MPLYSASQIPYDEFRAIGETAKAHRRLYGTAYRALIVFGPLVITGETPDIEILEVIENWQGPRRVVFISTAELPLRGRLTLYFLRPEEFERPTAESLPGEDFSALTLMRRVEQAYTVLIEEPGYYAYNVMRNFDAVDGNPLTFFAAVAVPSGE